MLPGGGRGRRVRRGCAGSPTSGSRWRGDDELFSVADSAGPAGPSLRVDPAGCGEPAVPGQQRVGRDDEPVTDPPGDHTGEPGDHATVDVGELGTARGSLQDRDLVTERDDFGFEHSARFAAGDHQLDDCDEQPVDKGAKSGTERGGRAGRHEPARLRPATPQGPAGRADRVSGTYKL